MAYADKNFKTKKALKEAVALHIKGEGPAVTFHQPGGLFACKRDGRVSLEGPHYPKPHSWYADCDAKDGIITKVR
jgi:hypothetical protein